LRRPTSKVAGCGRLDTVVRLLVGEGAVQASRRRTTQSKEQRSSAQGKEGLAAVALVPSPSSFPSFPPFLNTSGDGFGGNPHSYSGHRGMTCSVSFIWGLLGFGEHGQS
jgi:hypothetical protein